MLAFSYVLILHEFEMKKFVPEIWEAVMLNKVILLGHVLR